MIYPSVVFSEDGVLLEKGGGGTRHFMDTPFGQGLVKASVSVCIAVELSADAGMRLMPGPGGGLLRWTVMLLIRWKRDTGPPLQFLFPLVLHTHT